MLLKEILAALDAWAPPGIAQSYDNVGLQVGDPNQEVKVGLVALEITPEVLQEAREIGAQVIVTHHPLLFRSIRSLAPTTLVGSMAFELARSGIGLLAAHTNLDAVEDGVSSALATQLGLAEPRILAPVTEGVMKLVTFVPSDHVEQVRAAISKAGAGRIGHYSDVAFKSEGVGLFRPLPAANPFIGSAGGPIESVPEWRLEAAVTSDRLAEVIEALLDVHPYEAAVYDVYEMAETVSGFGLGMIGDLAKTLPLSSFLSHVCRALDAPAIRYAGDPTQEIRRVAVCGGAGRDLIPTAIRKGADAFVTADIGYHSFFDVLRSDGESGMALIDAGHYETEVAVERLLLERLSKDASAVRWMRTGIRTSPVTTYVAQ